MNQGTTASDQIWSNIAPAEIDKCEENNIKIVQVDTINNNHNKQRVDQYLPSGCLLFLGIFWFQCEYFQAYHSEHTAWLLDAECLHYLEHIHNPLCLAGFSGIDERTEHPTLTHCITACSTCVCVCVGVCAYVYECVQITCIGTCKHKVWIQCIRV